MAERLRAPVALSLLLVVLALATGASASAPCPVDACPASCPGGCFETTSCCLATGLCEPGNAGSPGIIPKFCDSTSCLYQPVGQCPAGNDCGVLKNVPAGCTCVTKATGSDKFKFGFMGGDTCDEYVPKQGSAPFDITGCFCQYTGDKADKEYKVCCQSKSTCTIQPGGTCSPGATGVCCTPEGSADCPPSGKCPEELACEGASCPHDPSQSGCTCSTSCTGADCVGAVGTIQCTAPSTFALCELGRGTAPSGDPCQRTDATDATLFDMCIGPCPTCPTCPTCSGSGQSCGSGNDGPFCCNSNLECINNVCKPPGCSESGQSCGSGNDGPFCCNSNLECIDYECKTPTCPTCSVQFEHCIDDSNCCTPDLTCVKLHHGFYTSTGVCLKKECTGAHVSGPLNNELDLLSWLQCGVNWGDCSWDWSAWLGPSGRAAASAGSACVAPNGIAPGAALPACFGPGSGAKLGVHGLAPPGAAALVATGRNAAAFVPSTAGDTGLRLDFAVTAGAFGAWFSLTPPGGAPAATTAPSAGRAAGRNTGRNTLEAASRGAAPATAAAARGAASARTATAAAGAKAAAGTGGAAVTVSGFNAAGGVVFTSSASCALGDAECFIGWAAPDVAASTLTAFTITAPAGSAVVTALHAVTFYPAAKTSSAAPTGDLCGVDLVGAGNWNMMSS